MKIKYIMALFLIAMSMYEGTAHAAEPCPLSGVWPAGCVPAGTIDSHSGASDRVLCPTSGIWPQGCIPPNDSHDSNSSQTQPLSQGQVVGIVDGDTIDVRLNGITERVRLIGMDTPERGQPCFSEATQALNRLIFNGWNNGAVRLEKDVSERDRYGRLLRYIFVGDLFLNVEMVRLGYAKAVRYSPDTKYATLLEAQEASTAVPSCHLNPPAQTPISTPPPAQQPAWQPSPAPSAPSNTSGQLIISYVFADGHEYQTEGDEYAEIRNMGTQPINLGGYRLNAGDPGQDFQFPSYVLGAGQRCRVYTNRIMPKHCGFSYRSTKPVWNNKGDCGYLYDSAYKQVGTPYCYGNKVGTGAAILHHHLT